MKTPIFLARFTTLATLLLMTLAMCPLMHAQVVQLPSDWDVDDTITIERISLDSHADGVISTSDSKHTSIITITVIEKNENGYLLKWSVTTIKDPRQAEAPVSLTKKITDLVNAITLYIRTDEHGTPISMEKHEQTIEQIDQIVNTITKQLKEQDASEQTIDRALSGVKPLTDPVALEAAVLYEPVLLLKMVGKTLILNEPIRSQGHHRNPLGVTKLPALIQYVLTHHNPTNHEAIIDRRKYLDNDKANQILKKMYFEWAKKNPTKTSQQKEIPKLKIEESTTYHMDTQTGWPRLVTQQRVTINGSRKVVEQVTFRLLGVS